MIYVSHLIQDEELKEITSTSRLGIESIEFSVAENLDNMEQTLSAYKKRLAFMECENLILHGPFLDLNPMAYDRLVAEATRNRYEQAYQAAKELGAKKLILHSGYIPSVYLLTGWAERMADFYNRFLEDKDASVEILMENVMDPFPAPLKEIMEKVSHPAFGICFDMGHANCFSNISGKEWAEILFPYIRHFHVHDNPGDRDRHLALGEGTVPYRDILELFQDKKELSCTIECSRKEDVLKAVSVLSKTGNFVDKAQVVCYD